MIRFSLQQAAPDRAFPRIPKIKKGGLGHQLARALRYLRHRLLGDTPSRLMSSVAVKDAPALRQM